LTIDCKERCGSRRVDVVNEALRVTSQSQSLRLDGLCATKAGLKMATMLIHALLAGHTNRFAMKTIGNANTLTSHTACHLHTIALITAIRARFAMADKGTTRDHLDDVREELQRTRHVLQNMTDTAHRLHREAEEHKAANEELRYQLELAREEANQAYKRADRYRSQATAIGEELTAQYATVGKLMRELEELRGE
jgi:methyl-accepting chemotaxis protein